MDSLCPLDRLWSSLCLLDEAFSLLVPFVNHDKKGEKLWFLFTRFYMLGEEIHALVRGSCVSSHLVRGSAYLLLLIPWVLWPLLTYIILIFFICDVCLLHLPLYVLFLFYLCTHVSCSCMQSIYFCLTQRCLDTWWVLFKVFQKYRLSKFTYHKLSSCKVFQIG